MSTSVIDEKKPLEFTKAYKTRTMWIGLAFCGILLVWQLYNSYCSPMLSFLFAKSEFKTEFDAGKAVYDAFAAAFKDPANANLESITIGNITIAAGKLGSFDMKFLLQHDFIDNANYLDIQWKVGIIMALDNIAALFIMPIFGNLSDKTKSKWGKRTPYIIVGSIVTAIALPFIPFFFNMGMDATQDNITAGLVGMICTMVVIIVFMMSYRSPAVALMPDLTPKPLRSKANGLINIVGYIGGAVGSVLAIVIAVSKYIDGTAKSFWTLEIPFIVCSVCLLVSLALLLIKVKENKMHEELDAEIKAYDDCGESAEQVTTTEKLSKTNVRNLALILIAEIFWFMSLNSLETFQTNYLMFEFNTASSGGAIMTVVSGAASIIGFLVAGRIADKIGRKWTIFTGICIVTICYVLYSLFPAATQEQIKADGLFQSKISFWFLCVLPVIGFSTSLIHICSFPLVTDYCTADKLGKYTSLYYTASMLAQSVTPILIGLILKQTLAWRALPIYAAVLMACAGVVFFFVKAPHKNDKGSNAKGLDALGADD